MWGEVTNEGVYFNQDTDIKLSIMAYFRYENSRPECLFKKEKVFISYDMVFSITATELFDWALDREKDIQVRNGAFSRSKPLPRDSLLPFGDSSKESEQPG